MQISIPGLIARNLISDGWTRAGVLQAFIIAFYSVTNTMNTCVESLCLSQSATASELQEVYMNPQAINITGGIILLVVFAIVGWHVLPHRRNMITLYYLGGCSI